MLARMLLKAVARSLRAGRAPARRGPALGTAARLPASGAAPQATARVALGFRQSGPGPVPEQALTEAGAQDAGLPAPDPCGEAGTARVRLTASITAIAPAPGAPAALPAGHVLSGRAYVIDGDTIEIRGWRIRLAGIDAPEMDQPWGRAARSAMIGLCRGQTVHAEILEGMSYDRLVARCRLGDGTDLSAALVARGLALDWRRFSGGRYAHLEPEGIRKRLWRVAAKHRGAVVPRM